MATCPSCGQADPGDRDFCGACGAYLRWDEDPAQTDTAVLTPTDDAADAETKVLTPVAVVAAAPEPVVIQHERVIIVLEPDTAGVDPGGSTTLTVSVRNQSGIVDSYDLRVQGMPGPWWTAAPPALDLVPFGADSGSYEGKATVSIHPPRTPEARAGQWEVQVVAVSRVSGETVAAAPARITIAAYERFESRIRPERARGGGSARFNVPVRNLGNAPLALTLRGEDADGEASFRFEPPRLQVPPGGEAHAAVTVSAPAPRSGGDRERRLTVFAEGAEQTLSGHAVFVQHPRVTRARVTGWRIVLGLLAVALIAGASFMKWAGDLRGVCLHADSSCLRYDAFAATYLNVDVKPPDVSGLNGLIAFFGSAGFVTLVLALLVLLGLRRGTLAWFAGVLTAVYVVVLLILGDDAGAGLFVALVGSLLAVAAGLLTTARS